MARHTGPVCKLCRREGMKLFLKGNKCTTNKCPLENRAFAPGQHGRTRRFKQSEYGMQLREKQKVKRIYGVLERQFRSYFEMASRQKGITGENLLQLLERRLDNVVFRLGFAPSRRAARQLVRHRHFAINGQIVDIPSYLVRPGDRIQVRPKSRTLDTIHTSMRRVREGRLVPWLDLDKAGMIGTFRDVPSRTDIPVNVSEQLIVELYSK